MPTAQEIYDALIQNPDYQNIGNISREEVVKREALRRARQHANNEKALSMAVQNSALGKLSAFVQDGFVQDAFLQKAFTDYDRNVLTNIQQHAELIRSLNPYIQSYHGGQDEEGQNIDGWKTRDNPEAGQADLGQDQRYRMYQAQSGAWISVFNFAPQVEKWYKILNQILDFSDSVVNDDGQIPSDPPMGIADIFVDDEDATRDVNRLFNDNSTLKLQAIERMNLFKEKSSELHEGILNDGLQLRTVDEGGGPTPIPAPTPEPTPDPTGGGTDDETGLEGYNALDRFHQREFLQWMGQDTTGISPGAMHNRQGAFSLDQVLNEVGLDEFQRRLAHYNEAHELYPEPVSPGRGSRLGAERMQQRAAHFRSFFGDGDGGGDQDEDEDGGGGDQDEDEDEVTGNANHPLYAGMEPQDKENFHSFMVPEARMNELSLTQFDNALTHFVDGITRLPGDLAAQEEHWRNWDNPLNPTDEETREDEDEEGDEDEDTGGGTGGGGGTGQAWTGSTERLPYGADFDVDAYSNYIPKQIDGDDPPVLKPKDLEGNEFDPLDGVEDDATLREKLASLKELYMQFHAENDGETATLGRGTYFPQEPAEGGNAGVLKFKKDEFGEDKVAKYNELNSSKAVMEEYLKLMHGMTQGYIGSPWHDSQSYADGVVTGVWQDRPDVGSESYRFIPQDGAYEWHTILETLSNTDWEQGGAVRDGDAGRDSEGNLNWHMIPSEYMTSWTYHNALQHMKNFVGTVASQSGIPTANRDLTENQWREFARRFVENNPTRFPGLAENTTGSGNKFTKAFTAWKNTAGANVKDTDAFIEWMEGAHTDGQPRWQGFLAGTIQSPRTPRTPRTPQTEADDDEGGAVLPRLDGAGIDTTLDPEKRDAMINRLMATERRHGNFEGDDEQVHKDYLTRLSDGNLEKEHDKHVVEANRAARRKASENAAKDEGHLTHSRRQEMIRDYISSHKEMYNQTLDPRLVKVLEEKSDKDLQQMHGKMMQDHGDHSRKAGESLRTYRANNIDFSIKSLAPLQEHLTKEDILMQARRLLHHQQSYGDIMDGDAKKVWKERMQEAHQLADAANMNLDMRLHEDMEKADEHGDFGSTAWLERVGEAHVGTQNRRHAHQEAVSRGGELRTNRNYKPHIVARYDDAGEFQGFHDLSWVMDGQPGGMPVDQHMLQFDEDNHYHFHGLDETKVKEYQKYLAMKKEERPSEIPPVFGPPPKPTHNELKELEDKVHGTDYKDVRDRFEEVGELSGAEESFYKKFNMRPTGRPGRPKNSDGSEADIPRFLKDANDSQGVQGWYHPESGSWINPHRYQELIDHMEGQSNAGRVVMNGQQFYGKGNTADPNYAFALPTEAKSKQFRSGYGDQSYYIDGTGAIAHAQDSYDAGHIQDHIQPQSVNGVIHDWYAQQIGNQMKANPKVFRNEEGKARQVAVVDSPPQTPMGEESPFQNMWLALAAGESLGREPGSALARRDKKKSSGWEWFDRKLGQHGGSDIKEGIARAIHPMSATARDPLSSQELGQEQWWTNTQEAKQKYFDVINYPRSGLLSWVGKLLIGGEKPEDKVIRRIRQGYQQQAMTEKLTREAADKITVNGKRLSESYVAPGEQSARTEDYDELKRFFTHQKNVHTNLRNVAQSEKNEENAKEATNQLNKYTQHSETLAQLDSKAPNHWERINALYDDHLGKVNQAPTAADSLQDMGSRLQQQQQQQQLGQWAGEMNQPTEKDPITLPEVQVNHPDIPRIFGAGKQAEIPPVFV